MSAEIKGIKVNGNNYSIDYNNLVNKPFGAGPTTELVWEWNEIDLNSSTLLPEDTFIEKFLVLDDTYILTTGGVEYTGIAKEYYVTEDEYSNNQILSHIVWQGNDALSAPYEIIDGILDNKEVISFKPTTEIISAGKLEHIISTKKIPSEYLDIDTSTIFKVPVVRPICFNNIEWTFNDQSNSTWGSKNVTVLTNWYKKLSNDNKLRIPVFFAPGVNYEVILNDEIITETCSDVNELSVYGENGLNCSMHLLQPEQVSTDKWNLVMYFQFEWTGSDDQVPGDINFAVNEINDSMTPLISEDSSVIDVQNGVVTLSGISEALVKYLDQLDSFLRQQNIINNSIPLFRDMYPNIDTITELGRHIISFPQAYTEVDMGQQES